MCLIFFSDWSGKCFNGSGPLKYSPPGSSEEYCKPFTISTKGPNLRKLAVGHKLVYLTFSVLQPKKCYCMFRCVVFKIPSQLWNAKIEFRRIIKWSVWKKSFNTCNSLPIAWFSLIALVYSTNSPQYQNECRERSREEMQTDVWPYRVK